MQTLEREAHVAGPIEEKERPRMTVGTIEKALGLAVGSALSIYGVRTETSARKRRDHAGLMMALAGAAVLVRSLVPREKRHRFWRMVRGEPRSPSAAVNGKQSVKARGSVTIARDPEELYRFWRDVRNLPKVMDHVEAVEPKDGGTFHWVVKGPLGSHLAWDATIIADEPNRLIAWRSLDGADVSNAGSVWFRPAPGRQGTEVTVELRYEPPGGALGTAVAKLLGEIPNRQIEADLHHFKQLMETGEIPTTEGQPAGGRA